MPFGSHLKKQHSGQHAISIRDSALCLLPSIVGTVWSHICKSRPPNGGADERPRKPLKVRKANPWRSERPDGQNHLHTRSRPLVDSLLAVDFSAAKLFLLPLDNQVRATPATAFKKSTEIKPLGTATRRLLRSYLWTQARTADSTLNGPLHLFRPDRSD